MTRRVLAIGGLLLLCRSWRGSRCGLAGSSTPRPGLHFVLRRLETLSAVSITASGARGTLSGPLEFDTLVIDHEAVRIDARELRLQPELSNLLSRTISITSAEAGTLEVTLRRRGPQPPSEPHFMPHPLRLLVGRFDLRRVALVLANGQRYSVASINGALTMDHWVLHAPIVTIKDPAGELAGEVRLRAGRPMGVTGTLSGRWRLPDGHDYRFSSTVRGNLDRLGTDIRLVQPARLSFAGNALDLTGTPRVLGTLRAIEFDGSPWVPAGRFPRVSGSIAINAGRNSIGVDGTLTSTGLIDEPLRLQGGGTWQGRVIEITTLRAWLPRSGASFTTSGKIDLAPESPVLALRGEWSTLRWPLAGEPVVTSAVGTYRIGGSLPYAYEVKAETAGAQIPAAAWHATGLVGRDALTIDAVDAYTLDGRIRGAGRLGWTGDQPWRFTVQARSLDLRRLRADLDGRIDLEGSIEGRGFGTNAPLTARVASLHGVLWGRSLTGSGEIERRDGNYELRAVRVANGDSYARVDGRYGPTLDLVLDADLRSLAIVDPQLSGRVTATRPRTGDALATIDHRRGYARDAPVPGCLRWRRRGANRSRSRRHAEFPSGGTGDRGRQRGAAVRPRRVPRQRAHHGARVVARGRVVRRRALPSRRVRGPDRGARSFRDRPAPLARRARVDAVQLPGWQRKRCCSRRHSIFRPRRRAPRRSVSRPARRAVLRGRTVEGASRELAVDLQRPGLALEAPADLAARVARVRRHAPGERLDRQGTGPGLARRDHGAARQGELRHTAQQVPHRARATRRRPARPVRRAGQTSARASISRSARTRRSRARRAPNASPGARDDGSIPVDRTAARRRPRRSPRCRSSCRRSTARPVGWMPRSRWAGRSASRFSTASSR